MKKYLIIYEDDKYYNLYPLTYLRPVFMLRPGIRYLYERIVDGFPDYEGGLFCRPEVADLTEENVRLPVNKVAFEDASELIFINGRLKTTSGFLKALQEAGDSVILKAGDDIAAFKLVGPPTAEEKKALDDGNLSDLLSGLSGRAETMTVELEFYNYLWDFIEDIHHSIADDFDYFRGQADTDGFLISRENMRRQGREYPGVEFPGIEQIFISRDAELMPGVVLDARSGPIFIGTRVKIEPNTYVIGPTYVGKDSILVGGKIDSCSIGPVCRAGGEVEETIIQGYTNKYHAGFLGHAYLGEWINLGAMTTNSDLKNNYAPVSVSINGETINTGSLKVGSFIGDFTKTAIGTLLNTGINIGVCCNIIPKGLVVEKEIQSFTWYSPHKQMKYSINKALETIKRTMARRDRQITDALAGRLQAVYDQYQE